METLQTSPAQAAIVATSRRLDEPVLQSAEDAVRSEAVRPAPRMANRLRGIVSKLAAGVGARPGSAALLAVMAGAGTAVLARGLLRRRTLIAGTQTSGR